MTGREPTPRERALLHGPYCEACKVPEGFPHVPTCRLLLDAGRETPRDPQDARFCTCGASRGHYGWWWSCEGLLKVLDAFPPESPPARKTT